MDIYDMALAMTPRIGGRTAAYLIDIFFSAENIFSTPLDILCKKAKLNENIARAIIRRDGFRAAEYEMKQCEKHNITPIAAIDLEYPSLLRETHDPPYIIYTQGERSILTHNLVSIVGTRRPSSYGVYATDLIVSELAKKIHNLVIVSGLAFGIDRAAHDAAMKNNIPTIAVLPNSLPDVTPASHTLLAREIINSGGALITELPSSSKTAGKAYIARNRIIAGMSATTIIAESPIKGGSMATARMANDEGRLVAAIPGRIVDKTAAGCNNLIAQRGAILLNSAEEIIRELKWEDRIKEVEAQTEEANSALEEKFDDKQIAIINTLSNSDPLPLTEIERATGISFVQLSASLMELELMGAIKAMPGARYISLIM